MFTSKCPVCKKKEFVSKVIYAALPMKLCENVEEHEFGDGEYVPVLFGFFSWFATLLFNGVFFKYTGNYFVGVYYWWKAMGQDE